MVTSTISMIALNSAGVIARVANQSPTWTVRLSIEEGQIRGTSERRFATAGACALGDRRSLFVQRLHEAGFHVCAH